MILVVGSAGALGLEVCERLRARGERVRGVVRPSSRRKSELQRLGVEIIEGDVRSAEVRAAACRGAEAVISTATAMSSKGSRTSLRSVDRDAQLSLVKDAKREGVRSFVYVSISPNHVLSAPLVRYKREVEGAIRASGMTWTILQPSNFMEIWLSSFLGWDFANGRATIFGSGNAPVSWISLADVAEYCVMALGDERLRNRDVPLGGPSAVAANDVVALFEQVSGKKFRVKRIPAAILSVLWRAVALIDEKQASGMALGLQAAKGDVVASEVQKTLPVTLTSVEDYARRVAARPDSG